MVQQTTMIFVAGAAILASNFRSVSAIPVAPGSIRLLNARSDDVQPPIFGRTVTTAKSVAAIQATSLQNTKREPEPGPERKKGSRKHDHGVNPAEGGLESSKKTPTPVDVAAAGPGGLQRSKKLPTPPDVANPPPDVSKREPGPERKKGSRKHNHGVNPAEGGLESSKKTPTPADVAAAGPGGLQRSKKLPTPPDVANPPPDVSKREPKEGGDDDEEGGGKKGKAPPSGIGKLAAKLAGEAVSGGKVKREEWIGYVMEGLD